MAIQIPSPWKSLQDLAHALGITHGVTAITIEATVKAPTKVKVEYFIRVPGMEGLQKMLKEYRLEPIEPEPVDMPTKDKPVSFREFT